AGAALMALAGVGWGVFSLQGRGARAPLATTATAFVLATPVAVAAVLLRPDAVPPQGAGIALAVISGAITSGLGYALWYAVLPQLGAARGAVAQLTVPVLAIAAGVVLLGEAPSVRMIAAGALVIGGVALSLTGRLR
ncbi:MAG: DMT family transporter, partial [Rhodobacteraceae bacterium]|nr:DMT family transporter [Paracoccaceae bacterium]